ncbi:MAG: iron ABC transporter permease, partial [Alphaproteobacteria bacterium]
MAVGKRLSPLRAVTLVIAVLFALPVLSVLANVFMPSQGNWPHLAATVLPRYVGNSLVLMLGVGAGVLIVGVATAWLVTACRFPGRRIFEWALILPLAVPTYVMAYAYTDFLQFSGPLQSSLRAVTGWGPQDFRLPEIRSLGGAVLIFIAALYPYVYLIVRAAFLQRSAGLLETGRTLGLGPGQLFRRLAVPLARPAMVAGVALALMETLADYGAVAYFGVQTFTTGIYRTWFSLGDQVAAAQLAAGLLGFVVLLLLLERWSRRDARYHRADVGARRPARIALQGWHRYAALLACALPVLLGSVLPALVLLSMFLGLDTFEWPARYGEWVWNTLSLGLMTAAIATVLALLIAAALRAGHGHLMALAGRLAGLGYAIPGSIIAVGVLIPFAAFDTGLDGWMRTTFGVSTGLLLTGTGAGLIFAYLVRFLAVSLQSVQAGFERLSPSLDAAARSLGAREGRLLSRIHLPLLKGTLLTAFLMVFVDVMKELPATLIMRPFNFDTLAVTAHNFAIDERLAEAALPSLTIVAVGLLPVI